MNTFSVGTKLNEGGKLPSYSEKETRRAGPGEQARRCQKLRHYYISIIRDRRAELIEDGEGVSEETRGDLPG